ncbi:MAG: TonB-dependent receptor [Eudoraea sp.]|uniref:TonB-dependent receptor n=2 Tax=Eudoraea sp. TaxID=1979955 RepID=UPI003C766443
MRKAALIILLLCSITTSSQNCNYTLSGTVMDLHDGSLLEGAMLIVSDTGQEVTTDLDGKFIIPALCEGQYSIQVSHPFCLTKGFVVNVSQNTIKTFRLEHHLEELNEVIVKGKAYSDKSNTKLVKELSEANLERYSSATLGDALNSISGVSSLNTGNTIVKPMINGLHSSRVVIINNEVRMQDQEWGTEHAPNLDINTAAKISVIKGAGGLQYGGDAIGGVIIAEAAKMAVKDSLFGKTILNGATNGRGGALTTSLTKSFESGWYGTIQGTLKRFGDFEAPDYELSNTGLFERDFSIRAGINRFDYGLEAFYSFYKNEIGILLASHLGGAQDQVRAINSDVPLIINDFTYDIMAPKQDVTHNLARIKGYKRINNFGKISLQYDFQRNNRLEFDIRRGDDRDKASIDLQLDTHTLLLDLDYKLFQLISLKSGILGRYQKNFADPSTGVRRLIPDYDKYELGIYTLGEYSFNDHWLLEAGVRFDYSYMDVLKFYRTSFWEARNYDELVPEIVVEEFNNQILTNPQPDFNNLSASLGATYTFSNNYKLFLNYGLSSRAPNPAELFSEGLHHSASRIELGDLLFESEIGHNISISFQKKAGAFVFAINPYINTINNFIVLEPTGIQQTIRGNFQVWEYRQTNAQLLGFDVDINYNFNKFFGLYSQFSLVKGYDRERDEPLINMPPVSTKNALVYQNQKLNNLWVQLQSEYVFRQNEFPDNNFEVFIPETGTTELVDVSTPPPAYHLFNFDATMDFKMNSKSTLGLGFTISNLLNTSYRNYLNRFRFYADDLGRNFLLTLKINY